MKITNYKLSQVAKRVAERVKVEPQPERTAVLQAMGLVGRDLGLTLNIDFSQSDGDGLNSDGDSAEDLLADLCATHMVSITGTALDGLLYDAREAEALALALIVGHRFGFELPTTRHDFFGIACPHRDVPIQMRNGLIHYALRSAYIEGEAYRLTDLLRRKIPIKSTWSGSKRTRTRKG